MSIYIQSLKPVPKLLSRWIINEEQWIGTHSLMFEWVLYNRVVDGKKGKREKDWKSWKIIHFHWFWAGKGDVLSEKFLTLLNYEMMKYFFLDGNNVYVAMIQASLS